MRSLPDWKMYTVYKHTAPSGKAYIGITRQDVSKRWDNGRGYRKCPRFYLAIKKYGWENITHEILFVGLTKREAEQKEIELIAQYCSADERFGYNLDNGGNCCGTHSEETKQKIGAGNRGKVFSAETIEKMKRAHKGKQVGQDNPFYGRKHTEAIIKQHSDFMLGNDYFKGKHHSDEFKKAKSIQMKQKYADGRNPKCKKVICSDEDNNIIAMFISLREVARKYKVSAATVYKWIHLQKQKNGYFWRYADE